MKSIFRSKMFSCMLSLMWIGLLFCVPMVLAQEADPGIDEILTRVEKRYAGPGFEARFNQTTTIQALDIHDSAHGLLLVKRPSMMRWEYKAPEKQTIITDGRKLWVYRPELNQVMVGAAPDYLGDGQGAGFLADIGVIRKSFSILEDELQDPDYYILNLLPIKAIPEVSFIKLFISKKDFAVRRISTFNPYGDETRIELSDFSYDQKLDDSLFEFKAPEGTDIIQIDK